ncbi:hypothetical protein FQN51_003545 [Onygenales sp. PD_10]|nr:hypothetical protein FQN51_003545 [Onygenales sp. PD_10]
MTLSLSLSLPLPLPILTFILGLITTPLLLPALASLLTKIATLLFNRSGSKRESQDHSLYSLDHGVLNIPSFVPAEMWMNMGYWKNTNSFTHACRALLDKILHDAGLNLDADNGNEDSVARIRKPKKTRRVILDVGIGCGQQTLHLMNKRVITRGENASGHQNSSPLFDHYIGVTIEKLQCEFARSRVAAAKKRSASGGEPCTSAGDQKPTNESDGGMRLASGAVDLFCGDAAKPSLWPPDMKRCISDAFLPETSRGMGRDVGADKETLERYVLGLDTLYHFSPSREELFRYSHSSLGATLLAFDLFLPQESNKSSGLDKLKQSLNILALRLLTPALSAPFSNFVTIPEYKMALQRAGYASENITIEDITSDVFSGLAGFLETRVQEMDTLGLSGTMKWRISGWLFRWLSGGQVLRAGIVVARPKGTPEKDNGIANNPIHQHQDQEIR